MVAPILKTKLHIPQLRSNVVPRPRLIQRLNEGSELKLTLVSAPAGFGKTTLVSEWLMGCNCPVAWLSLDERDNDTTLFLCYFLAALQTIQEDFGKGLLDEHHSLQSMGIESFLTILINEITTMPKEFVFVLDDYHVIDNPSINEALVFLLKHMPSHMRLVITTRLDPNLPLARLRAKNQLVEVRATDLRFSHTEAAGFLNQVMGLNLSEKDIGTLETRTEGWIAGLQLAAISIKGSSDGAGFLESFSGSHSFIMDYLIEEVLKQQSEEIQSFLLHTSLLERFCGSLCDAMMQRPSAFVQNALEYLKQANLFIVPLDNEHQWYRYHHLFADLLRLRLTKFVSQGFADVSIAELHRRACGWFENNGFTDEAIQHAIAAEDYEKAAALVELSWSKMDKSLQSSTWIKWVKRIPEELIQSRPVLSAGYAWALLDTGDIESCEQRLKDAEKGMDLLLNKEADQENYPAHIVVSDEEQFRHLPATIATARAYKASALGDSDATITHAERALIHIPDDDYHNKRIVNTLLGLAQWTKGNIQAAFSTIAGDADHDHTVIGVAVVLAELQVGLGNLPQAITIYEKSLKAALEKGGAFQKLAASFYLGLGRIKWLQGDSEGAEGLLEKSMEAGEKGALPNWRYQCYLLQSLMKENQGYPDSALELLNEAEKHYFRAPIPDLQPLDAMKTRLMIKQGKIHQALDWAKTHRLSAEDPLCFLREFEHITLARLLIGEYRHFQNDKSLSDAKFILDRLLAEARNGSRMGSVIEILILKSLAHEASGNLELALDCLQEAVKKAEPIGFVQVFADEAPIYPLLSDPTIYAIAPGFVSRLRKLSRTMAISKPGISQSHSDQVLLEPLSERELEVLQLISQGLTNHEICDRLFLALSTVKGYNQNLFGKLQVKNRTEAVARAHALGLV